MTETLANGYSSDSFQRGLSCEYPDDLVRMIFIIFCILVHLTKEATALEGLMRLSHHGQYVWVGSLMGKQI